MKIETAQVIINLMNAASKDETRSFLMGVNVEKGEDGRVKLTATDGVIMSHAEVMDESINFDSGRIQNESSFILSRDCLKTLKAYVKDFKNCAPMSSALDYKTLKIGDLELPIVDRDYPRYQSIIPKEEGKKSICFNVDKLTALVKTLGKRKVNSIKMSFNTDKEGKAKLSPISITAIIDNGLNGDAIQKMVIMPVKH
jgi:DNA polymerase III sliding clamp (beta) subunit (PCNA family)